MKLKVLTLTWEQHFNEITFKISFIFLFSSINQAFSDVPYYIDFKYILNSSVAGKKAQDELKKD